MAEQPDRRAERKRDTSRRWRQENAEYLTAYRRRYREEHVEHLADLNRKWREEHVERSRELNRESSRRQAARKRQRLERNARARARYPEIRDAAIERGRQFRRAHPEKAREYRRRYKERHPERVAATLRRYRDAHAEELRERQRLAAAARRTSNPDGYKDWYQRNLEEQRARGRNAARLRSRLKALGLPPGHMHRTYAADRRANDAAADEFFRRRRSADLRAAIATEADNPDKLEIPGTIEARRRQLTRVQPAIYIQERIRMATRSGEHRRRTQELAAERRAATVKAHKAADLQRVKQAHEAARQNILDSRPAIYESHRRRHQARVREEVRMDSIARELRSMPAYDIDSESARRLQAEASAIVRTRLEELRERTLSRVDRVIDKYDRAAPVHVPGSRPGQGRSLQ